MWIFVILSAAGLVLSIIVHICSILGVSNPLGESAWLLHVGIFVVWVPAVIVSQKLTRDSPQKDFWEAALRGCPRWMKKMTLCFFGYALLNFGFFMLKIFFRAAESSDESTPTGVFQGFSGHWMAFYSAALSVIYSYLHAEEVDKGRVCPNGHRVSPLAKFCEECGAEIIDNRD